MNDGVSIVFPCLNEAGTLAQCIEHAHLVMKKMNRAYEIVVADNGSTDLSREIARASGARVVKIATKGYGAAIGGGLMAAQYPIAVMLDCDLSYPVEDIPLLVAKIDEGYDFVLGNRLGEGLVKGAMPKIHRHLGTPVLSKMIRFLTGLPVYDCNSGLRAIRTHLFSRMALRSTGMDFASEMLMAAAGLKMKYKEVPIRFYKDGRGRPSHLRPVPDGIRHVRRILKSHFSSMSLT